MKERPILFSGPMVRAILEGRKTQTRRVVKWPLRSRSDGTKRRIYSERDISEMNERLVTWTRHPLFQFCPFGQVGDRLWVRETWAARSDCEPGTAKAQHYMMYRAEGGDPADPMNWHDWGGRWRPSIYMPRWASRITLEITSIRVERLQDITEEDCWSEGIDRSTESPTQASTQFSDYAHPRRAFSLLWESINGPGSWDLNPGVWVISFKRVEGGAK